MADQTNNLSLRPILGSAHFDLTNRMQPAATSRRLAVGSATPLRVGCWRLAGHLARGAWFDAYRAAPADAGPDWPADYVVKLPRSDIPDPMFACRLLAREVYVSQQVTHPHLVTVLDSQLQREPVFVTQPCYQGHTLRQALMRRSGLAISSALWIARQAADALAALHAAGWRHGDVKPENFIVSAQGHTTLIDLGFAERCDNEQNAGAVPALKTTLTYAAPEFFTPTMTASWPADVYSLGTVLYEMLSGRPAFHDDDPHQLPLLHLHCLPDDIRRAAPRVPSRVAQLLMRMLDKDPFRRPPCAQLVQQLMACEIECFDLI